MEKLIFETNAQHPSLVDKIKDAIEKLNGIHEWKIDLDSIYNLLTIEGIRLNPTEIESELALHGVEANRLYEE
ncbi:MULTISPECIES: hypothetical protein [Sphingobacterium]|uniref:Copper chaperone CopZ n=1 Tax=Sphingobacterium zeae TaxID=1776859 RepID=A0ABU0U5H5_9SPHI|nr:MULTISPECIES: hypothetical protein [Sphingobacterium]MDQ1150203.1 copper chaperone CopZ [Sphingobacterium zeae]MDR6736184.1 copper chaperone CopZ [Sphingobacterium sp. 2149]